MKRELEVPFAKEISRNYQNKKVQDLQSALAKVEKKIKDWRRKNSPITSTWD